MRLTGKQQKALSLIWCKPILPNDEAIELYFAYTDRGVKLPFDFSSSYRNQVLNQDLWDLLYEHEMFPAIIEMWKDGFKDGLLFLQGFDDERPALREVAYKAYYESRGFIPRVCKYRDEFLSKFRLPEYKL